MASALRNACMVLALVASPAHGESAADGPEIDHLIVRKSARILEAYSQGQLVRRIDGVQLGDAPVGPKHFQGDERTPEGHYIIDFGNPDSAYHLSLHISYPDARDKAFAMAQGRAPGGAIFIHGQPNGTAQRIAGDWTDGCIAVADSEIEWLWQVVPDGASIDILP